MPQQTPLPPNTQGTWAQWQQSGQNIPFQQWQQSFGQPSPNAQPSPIQTTQPVVTSQPAQSDAMQKFQIWQNIQNQIKVQKDMLQRKELMRQAEIARQDLLDANEKQANIENEQKQQEIDNKASALKMVGTPASQVKPGEAFTDTQGNQGVAQFDPKTGLPYATPPGKSAGGGIGETAKNSQNTALNQYTSALAKNQEKEDAATERAMSALNSVLAGTFPLSAPQQALVTSLQTQLQQNVAAQTVANKSYEGSVAQAAFRGGGEYTPAQMAGQIANAVSYGVAKIQALDNSAAKTIAELEQSFMKDDYTMITKQYDILMKTLDDKATAIKDTYAATTKAIQDQRDFSYKVTQDELSNKMKSDEFSYKQKHDAIQDAFDKGRIDETQRHNMMQEAIEWAKLREPTAAEKAKITAALKSSKESIPIMQDKIKDVDSLLASEGLNTRVGPSILARTPRDMHGVGGKASTIIGISGLAEDAHDKLTGAGQDFAGGVHRLISGLTLQSLIDAKARGATFGALSEGELNILANSASQLNDWELKDVKGNGVGIWNIDEKSFTKELRRIQDLTKRALILSGQSLISSEESAYLSQTFGSYGEQPIDPSLYY